MSFWELVLAFLRPREINVRLQPTSIFPHFFQTEKYFTQYVQCKAIVLEHSGGKFPGYIR